MVRLIAWLVRRQAPGSHFAPWACVVTIGTYVSVSANVKYRTAKYVCHSLLCVAPCRSSQSLSRCRAAAAFFRTKSLAAVAAPSQMCDAAQICLGILTKSNSFMYNRKVLVQTVLDSFSRAYSPVILFFERV